MVEICSMLDARYSMLDACIENNVAVPATAKQPWVKPRAKYKRIEDGSLSVVLV